MKEKVEPFLNNRKCKIKIIKIQEVNKILNSKNQPIQIINKIIYQMIESYYKYFSKDKKLRCNGLFKESNQKKRKNYLIQTHGNHYFN